ncbi:hypothetical protein D9M71_488710 [compost metagenome]
MADHRHPAFDELAQRRDLCLQPVEVVVHAHRAAHDGDGPGPLQVVAVQLAQVGAQHVEGMTGPVEHARQVAGRTEVRVGKNQDFAHAAQSAAKPCAHKPPGIGTEPAPPERRRRVFVIGSLPCNYEGPRIAPSGS